MSAATVPHHHPISFDPHDLAANRAGRLSPGQLAALRAVAARVPAWLPGARVAAFVVSTLAVGWMLWRATSTTQLVAVLAGGLAIDLAVPLAAWLVQRRAAANVAQATVHTAEGALRLTPSLARGTTTLEVGGHTFAVRSTDAFLFRRDSSYRCFFTELADGTLRLLSAEMVATGDASRPGAARHG